MSKILDSAFFKSRHTATIARKLLGKFLVREWHGKITALKITEVEVYDGFKDKASHAYRGMTPRNELMFGPGGYWYVYFTYGIHWMLNVVTGPVSYPAAILIRGVEGINGPARLTKALHINKKQNGLRAEPKNGLWIEDRRVKIKPDEIIVSPRIGVDYAGPEWAGKCWRFTLL